MSSTTTKKSPRKRAGAKTAQTKQGEQIPLVSPIPGGMAKWFAPGELTPGRSREYELIAMEMQPLIEKAIEARVISVPDGETREFAGFDGPAVALSRHEFRAFLELTDAATVAYLKEWTLDAPRKVTPTEPLDLDELLALPRPLYEALTKHGAKMLAATRPGFGVESLTADDLDDEDPDLPT